MKRWRSVFQAVSILIFICLGCGSSNSSGNTASGGTRNVTGTIVSASSSLSALSVPDCSLIKKVIATATDATTVVDDSLEDCSVELPLKVGNSYVISFVDTSDQFIATLISSIGSIFPIASGTGDISLGDISIADGKATFSSDIRCYIDTDEDGTVDCEDSTPCGGDSCSQYYSCEYFGFSDVDGDKICDEWDGQIPSGEDVSGSGESGGSDVLSIHPKATILYPGQTKQFVATVLGEAVSDTQWSLDPNFPLGSVNANGLYTAPATFSSNHTQLTAQGASNPSLTDFADIYLVEETIFGERLDLPALLGTEKAFGIVGLTVFEDSQVHLYAVGNHSSGIQLFRSDDGGETFSKTLVFGGSNASEDSSAIASDSTGRVFVVWVHRNVSGSSLTGTDIYFSRSIDGGVSFSLPITLSGSSTFNFHPALAVDHSGILYATWGDSAGTVYLAKSSNGGQSFGSPTTVATSSTDQDPNPQIATDETGRIYIAWWNQVASWYGNIFLATSDNGGSSFSSPLRVNDIENSVYAVNWGHDIAVDNNGHVYVVWGDVRNYLPQTGDYVDLFASTSSDHGATFSKSVQISQTSNYNQYPSLALDTQGSPYVCWRQANISGGSANYLSAKFSRSVDGQAWTTEKGLNSDTIGENTQTCDLAVDNSGTVYVIWQTVEPVPGSFYFVKSQ